MLLGLLGMAMGLYVSLYLIILWPGLVEKLSIQPNRHRPKPESETITTRDYPPSTFGFFTTIKPGQEKIIHRGGRFVKTLLDYARRMRKGERDDNDLTQKDSEYWEVIDTVAPYEDTHPIPFPMLKWSEFEDRPEWLLYSPLSILWWMWKRWVYNRTGYVFTGIPPFQTVRVYPMERFKRVTAGTAGNNKVTLVRKEDYSDHYRVAHFQYPALIAEADTRDNIPVNVFLNEVAQVFNSYMVAYNTDDDWPTRFLGSVSNRVTMFTRPRPLDEVWTAKSPETANELADFITLGGKHFTDAERLAGLAPTEGSTCTFGIRILETQVLDISPANKTDEQDLGNEARAKVQRKADEQTAIGRAAFIREEGLALKEHPYADVVVQTEAMVRAAEAVGKAKGTVFLNTGGQSPDQTSAAILRELQKLNENRSTP